MKKQLMAVMVVGIMGLGAGTAMAASTDSANINVLVTPVVSVDISVSPASYDFGNIAVYTSTCSVTAITLTNAGSVGFTVEKTVWNDGSDWDITKSSTEKDGFDLWAIVKDVQPGQVDFDVAVSTSHKFKKATGASGINTLIDKDTTAKVNMDAEATEKMWFRLDMPQSVTNVNQQTIQVRLKATNK